MAYGHCYIAKEKCGCVTGIVVDTDTGHITSKQLSEDLADFTKSGRYIERLTISEGKKRFMTKCRKHAIKAVNPCT